MDKILIIDPTEASAALMEKLLTRNGYDVMTMGSATGLFVNLKISAPDLIVLDTELLSESGYDICKKIKKKEETKYIPVLLMCISDAPSVMVKALEAGADDYMSKTVESHILISKVKSLIRIKHLSDQLKRQYTELQEKNNMIDMQLKMAMQVQRSLIHEFDFKINNVNFVSRYLPAMDIGGDFYDILKLNDDSVSVVIGDVSGHGISAALLTAMLNMMIKNYAPKYFNPAQFLYHMNNDLYSIFEDSNVSMYACVFYGVIDTKKKRLYYSNAGQALPIFVDSSQGEAFELEAFGTPIGMMEKATYEHRIQLFDDDDILLFYTDGLADNLYKNNADQFYKRMKDMLVDMSVDVSPQVIVNSLLSVFHNFDNKSNAKYELDDVSVILCKM